MFVAIYKSLKRPSIPPGKALDDYRNHKDAVINGRIHCINCGSNNIWMKELKTTMSYSYNSHICKECGTELYRTLTEYK